jgi:hypothetical protein
MEYIDGLMVHYMKVFIIMMKDKAMEFSKLMIIKYLKANGNVASEKEKVF